MKKGTKKKYVLCGGPLHGISVYLYSPGTLSMTVRGESGRYDHSNKWVPNAGTN